MARPTKKINVDEFKKLCGLMCTLAEIAWFFDCTEDTVESWCRRELKCSFSDAYKKHSSMGKISLRRMQFDLAKRSPAMAIFLGKVYLGQRETREIVVSQGLLPELIDGLREPVRIEE